MSFPVDVEFIRAAERKLGVHFPLSYTTRMSKENGGSVPLADDYVELFPIFDNSDRRRLKRTCNDIVRETKSARQWPSFPEDAVAIGGVDYGWLILRRETPDECLGDTVYFCDRYTGAIETVAGDVCELS